MKRIRSIESSDGKSIDRAKAVYGASLRELTKFFTKNDPNGNFCNLRRVVIPSTGQCCWTNEDTYKQIMDESGQNDTSESDEYDAFEDIQSVDNNNDDDNDDYDYDDNNDDYEKFN